jgi:lipopolysaccharide transport system permease protein
LLLTLLRREIKVRYKQTALGFLWAILQPLMLMLIFTLFFGALAGLPSEGIPYPIFYYCAMVPWVLFAEGINRSSMSLVQDANMIRKIYFPRLIMPLSSVLSPVVDFCFAFIILVGMMFFYDYMPTIRMLWIPLFILMAVVTSLGVGLWLSAINVKYRDVRYVIPFLTQLWLFASPIVYPSSIVPERFQVLYGINPMVGVIEGFRWSLLGTEPPTAMIGVSAAVTLLVLITGVFYFRRREKTFADLV